MRVRRVRENSELRGGARIVLGYVGVIGSQDGVDHLVRCLRHLVVEMQHRDVRAVVVGDGAAAADVRALAVKLGVCDRIAFTGYLTGDRLLAAVSTFDIGVIPDPANSYNDQISMNKLFEYSALGVPSVSYALTETRRLLGDAGSYADEATPRGLAEACARLIQDDELRRARGAAAKAVADARFDWAREAQKYVAAYERLSPAPARSGDAAMVRG